MNNVELNFGILEDGINHFMKTFNPIANPIILYLTLLFSKSVNTYNYNLVSWFHSNID
jgi:hypothetical protein